MGAKENHRDSMGRMYERKGAAKRKGSARQKRKMVLFGFEIAVIMIMLGVLYLVMNESSEGPKMAELDPQVLEIHEEIQLLKEEGGTMQGYKNIALFGLDAESESQLYKSSHSDSIMIASVNMDTGDIKLVSVYRDTYLNLGTDYYWKATQAYFSGGAEQAVKMLNMNLDMDITDFVAVGYKGLRDVIDGLGGIYIDVDSVELQHINNYQIGVSTVLKCDYTPVKETGYQLLDGLQATAYCRIRYGGGDDFKRTSRQREVLKALEERAKETDLVTLTKVFNDCIGNIYTSLDSKDILELLADIGKYSIVEENGFPQEEFRTVGNIGAKGSCVIPMDLESNVVWLHQFLFDDEDYTVTESVKEYGKQIETETSAYLAR
ncbi:MAG: LCP family protein [Lachnospiraceae bacterium]|uniref:LCP family protein n=1 Tax=uncultured Acetatifactor sp. TaxID=1671927 RepID=UPI0026070058|nr:LCP family protein [uncultured Acetatifactor sp.]MCI8789283.1 LCP family protein [Lachnospiraceae bacterium]